MNKENIKIIFFGTPKFAARVLENLIEKKYNFAAVVTKPDKKFGRQQKIVYSPVKDIAIKSSLPFFQPDTLNDKSVFEEIQKKKPDLFLVAAYGKILPAKLLDLPKFRAVNVHASLLPKYRGASPVQCAILAGEKETGITLLLMNEKMDEGDIIAQKKLEIKGDDTAQGLLEKLAELGSEIADESIERWVAGEIKPIAQDQRKATYCRPIRRVDGKIDWNQPAEAIFRGWRAYQPWPGIYSFIELKGRSKSLKLVQIGVAESKEAGEIPGKIIKYGKSIAVQSKKGLIVLQKIQLEGKKEMEIEEFLRGNAEVVGNILT